MASIKIALFASGTGSNVFNIINHFADNDKVEVVSVLSNKPQAGALNHGKNAGIETFVFNRDQFENTDEVLNYLRSVKADYLILAGFLWKIPANLIQAYEGKMLNVHPALLPSYGGKGMYGMNVHNAVVANKEVESGITIHEVNEFYDEGAIVARFQTDLSPEDTAEDVAKKIHALEKAHFPTTIEEFILKD